MEPDQTLHDFVLNLLSDAQAFSAFAANPEGALSSAGLGDITAADVQDVIPLVLDYAPVHSIPGLAAATSLVPSALNFSPAADTGQVGAIQQLSALTSALTGQPLPELALAGDAGYGFDVDSGPFGVAGWAAGGLQAALGDVTATAAGSVAFGPQNLGALGDAGLPLSTQQLFAANDVTDLLDGDVVKGAAGQALGAVETAASTATGAAALVTGAIADPTAAIGGLAGVNPVGLVQSLTGFGPAGFGPADVLGGLPGVGSVAGLAGDLPGVGDVAGLAGHLPGVGDVAGLAGSLPGVGDVAGLAGHLPGVGDVAGLAGHLPGVGDVAGLAGFGPADVLGGLPGVGNVAGLAGSVPGVGDVAGLAGHLPGVGDVGGLAGGFGAATQSPLADLTHTGLGEVGDPLGDATGFTHGALPGDLHLPGL